MTDQTRLAIVGCGGWGKNLVRNIAALGCLYAVCDHNPDTALNFATEFNARALSFAEIIADRTIDGVMIAAPSALHFDYAKAVLNSGKHVYVEKPVALNASDAEVLAELSRYTGRVLMVGHLLNYHGAFLKLLQIIADGRIGDVKTIEARRLGRGPVRENDNVLWDLASHDISMVLRVAGAAPQHVSASASAIQNNMNATSIPFYTEAHLNLQFGTINAHIHASWLSPVKEHKLIVTGTRGAIVFDDTQRWNKKLLLQAYGLTPQPRQWNIDWAEPEYIALEPDEPLRNECRHFIDCIHNDTTPQTDGAEALRVARVIEAAQFSIGQQT